MPNMLIVGGLSRNVGKTTFLLRLIEHFACKGPLVAVKVTSVSPGGESFHGKHDLDGIERYSILEETDRGSDKDTSKMLRAGAGEAFLVSARDRYIKEALSSLFEKVDRSSLFVCESNSLRRIINPGLFVMIRSNSEKNIKQNCCDLVDMADIVSYSDGKGFKPGLEVIGLKNGVWRIEENSQEL